MEEPPSTKRREKRLHSIPPPPVAPDWRSEVDALEDVEDALALTLWRALRNVREWAEVPTEARAGLFPEPTAAMRERFAYAIVDAPELTEVLSLFAVLAGKPEGVAGRQVAWACDRVRAWAEDRSLMLTALHFAEAAALADPEDPVRANAAARMCRRAAKQTRASMWYERGFKLAARARNRREAIHALLGNGQLLLETRHFASARSCLERAVKRARRTGRRSLVAQARHNLMWVSTEQRRFDEALEHALHAARLYSSRSSRYPYFAHDAAYVLVRCRQDVRALLLLERIAQILTRPDDQVLVWATLAIAAAGAGHRDRYDFASQRVIRLAAVYEEHAAAALVCLAEGASVMGDSAHAEQLARQAEVIAIQRGNEPELSEARDLLNGTHVVYHAVPVDEDAAASLFRVISTRLRKRQT